MLRKHKIQSMNNTGGRLENEASSIGGKNVALTVPAGALSGDRARFDKDSPYLGVSGWLREI